MWSSPSWWEEPLRVELDEIMDDLEPGWSAWRPVVAAERTEASFV